ncbi:MAG: AsmA family protein [Xanthomonadales bacterium]|nr:AsmA family protein [Xanthomonadales bacterium]
MSRLLKWLLAVVAIVVVVLVVATVVLPMVVDPNDYKDEISAAVAEKTGRELTIGGEIKWSVFPSVGLELSDVTLGNPEGFGDQPMLDIGEAGISVKLMPLLKRKVEVGEVSMNDVSIHLSRKADGRNNWAGLGGDTGAGDKTTSSDTGGGMSSFMVSGIEINNAKVTLDDVDQTTQLKEFELKATNIELGRPFKLQGGFSMNLPQNELVGDVKFGGLVQSEANGKRFGVEGLELSFKGNQGSGGESIALDANISANADIDLTKDQAVLSDFVLRLYDLSVTGDLTVSSLMAKRNFTGQLKVAEFNPKSFMQDLGLEPPSTQNDKALTSLQAEMAFTGSNDSADMKNLSVRFDQSTFDGNLKVVNFDFPKLAFDFQVDRFNLDDYSPVVESTGGSSSGEGTEESDLSVDMFRGFTGGGDFRVSQLVVAGLTATDVRMKMSSDGKSVRFSPVNANFYGGKHEGEIRVDASGTRPLLTASHDLTGVQAQDLLNDLTGSARLEGKGDFFLKISTDLSNSDSVLQALSGDIGMSIFNGAIVGIDVAETIGAVKAVLGKKSEVVSESDQGKKTEFAELTMSGVFDRGILSSDDLLMESPLLRATGKGSFNLVEESMNYVLSSVLLGDLGESLGALSGVPIPFKLSGNLYEPDIRVDIVAALAGSQKEKITKKADEYIGKLLGGEEDSETDDKKDDSAEENDPASSLLKGLLGGKKKSDKKKDDDGGS